MINERKQLDAKATKYLMLTLLCPTKEGISKAFERMEVPFYKFHQDLTQPTLSLCARYFENHPSVEWTPNFQATTLPMFFKPLCYIIFPNQLVPNLIFTVLRLMLISSPIANYQKGTCCKVSSLSLCCNTLVLKSTTRGLILQSTFHCFLTFPRIKARYFSGI